ncbi:hypothetical protein AcW1_010124 [Taiwanofungus camphoratus]|nr:hypothetical protein AcV5_003019 [Antrodia cinnamomea]KAI0946753.1 hypothetical protein AcW1_010124 [Antrodia cinnamomea]KAI0954261.1 hypothetical protein AcV7_007539 [Antrodia cinnamomea]
MTFVLSERGGRIAPMGAVERIGSDASRRILRAVGNDAILLPQGPEVHNSHAVLLAVGSRPMDLLWRIHAYFRYVLVVMHVHQTEDVGWHEDPSCRTSSVPGPICPQRVATYAEPQPL